MGTFAEWSGIFQAAIKLDKLSVDSRGYVVARSEATWQSRVVCVALDCFALLAMTECAV
jgi:hypothetical protein